MTEPNVATVLNDVCLLKYDPKWVLRFWIVPRNAGGYWVVWENGDVNRVKELPDPALDKYLVIDRRVTLAEAITLDNSV